MMLTTMFLFLTALITSVSAQCDFKTVTPSFQRSISEFTLKIVKYINQITESHFFTSALSPWTLLAVISRNASDTTLQEIREVLQVPHSNCIVYFYLGLMQQMTNDPASSMLERSSTIFFNASLNVEQSFIDDLSKGGFDNSRIMYFANPQETASSINAHVRRETDKTIKNMVTLNDVVGISALTIDAMSFSGVWKIPFPYEDTETDAFYDSDGQQIGYVSLMYLCESFNVTTISDIQATVLELPYYGDVQRYSMLIFLPKHKISITTILDSMESINISSIFNLYEQTGPKRITVRFPRFHISSNFDEWRELLKSMGVKAIFDQQEANFSGISYYQSFLTNFIQKTQLEVNEDGIVNDRAAVMLMQSRFMYYQFVANKPFMFMIVDRILHVPILTGAYSKPSICKNE